MPTSPGQITELCFSCGQTFAFGQNAYHGRVVPKYQIMVCRQCYDANWGGWAPFVERKLLVHLKAKGLEVPARNAQGLLPRD